MKNDTKKFEIATFKSDVHCAIPVAVGLTFKVAVDQAKEIWKSNKYYGVAVIDQTPYCPEPIQWLKSNSIFLENIELAEDCE